SSQPANTRDRVPNAATSPKPPTATTANSRTAAPPAAPQMASGDLTDRYLHPASWPTGKTARWWLVPPAVKTGINGEDRTMNVLGQDLYDSSSVLSNWENEGGARAAVADDASRYA